MEQTFWTETDWNKHFGQRRNGANMVDRDGKEQTWQTKTEWNKRSEQIRNGTNMVGKDRMGQTWWPGTEWNKNGTAYVIRSTDWNKTDE